MYRFAIPLGVGLIIQCIKICVDVANHKTFHRKNLWSAWGFPSVHSAVSSSVTTLIGLQTGIESLEFAMAFSFSFLFWYDAMNVRYESGKHAHYINTMRHELQNMLSFQKHFHMLKERIGHTPLEVGAGIVSGCILTTLTRLFLLG
jgi:acid phosphatase family membrane protein YuiD